MNGINKKIQFGLLPMIFSLVCLLLSSCFNDEYDDVSTTSIASDYASIRFQITTGEMGDLNATRAEGEDDPDLKEGGTDNQQYAVAGEYINTLCVFMLNAEDSVIEVKIEPNLMGTAAVNGNLPNYTSEAFEVVPGEKIFYAFANWDNTESDEWLSLIDKEVGETILPSDVDFEVEAVKHVDIADGKYIPMSMDTTGIVISGNDLNFTREIELPLNRMVAKVEMKIYGDESKDVKIDSLLFSGTAKTVPLMSLKDDEKKLPDSYFDNDAHVVFSNQIIPKDSFLVDTFYINESYRERLESGGSGFGITLNLATTGDNDEYDGTEYTATTPRVNVERNSVYPIELTLNKYITKLSVTAKTAPIGGEEVSYTTDANWDDITNSFKVELRDVTTSFTITPQLYSVSGDSIVSGVTWTLTDSETSDNISGPDSDDTFTIDDLTATPGYSYEFELKATWESSTSSTSATTTGTPLEHSRTYKLTVVFEEGEIYIGKDDIGSDTDGSYRISPQQWRQVLLPDRLNMTLKRKID